MVDTEQQTGVRNGQGGMLEMAVELGAWPHVEGLCGNKKDHEPHDHSSTSLGKFWCHADQSRRLPYAAEKAQQERFAK